MISQLFVVFCMLGLVDAVAYSCPSQFQSSGLVTLHKTTCYHFVVNQEKEFADAQNYCADNGGQLAIVKSRDVNIFIGDMLANKHSVRNSPVWIGLQYFGREKLYKWVDGSALGKYTSFMESYSDYQEDCVAMIPSSKLWRDFRCETGVIGWPKISKKKFVCEYPASVITSAPQRPSISHTTSTPETPLSKRCLIETMNGADVRLYRNKCYYIEHENKVTFQQAERQCELISGTLALVKSIKDNIILYDFISRRHDSSYWIGLKYNPGVNPDGYFWLDGTSLTFSHFGQDKQFECVAINSVAGHWVEGECHFIHVMDPATFGFICEFEPRIVQTPTPQQTTTIVTTTPTPPPITTTTTTTKLTPTTTVPTTTTTTITTTTPIPTLQPSEATELCPIKVQDLENLQVLQDRCYYFRLDEAVTFEKAELHCQLLSGKLVSVKTKKINSFLHHRLEHYLGRGRGFDFWIGLRYYPWLAPDGYYWSDNLPLSFENFARKKQFECVAINSRTGQWVELECHKSHFDQQVRIGYICEFETVSGSTVHATKPTQTTTSVTTTTSATTTKPSLTLTTSTPTTIAAASASISSTPTTTHTLITTTGRPITKADCPIQNKNSVHIYQGKCYYFEVRNRLTFQRAETFCTLFSGSLVRVTSKIMNTFLLYHLAQNAYKSGHLGSKHWIGLEYNVESGNYYWANGDAMTFQNFARKKQFQCAAMNSSTGMWEEGDCHSAHSTKDVKLGFICEIDLGSHSSTTKEIIVSTSVTPSTSTPNYVIPTKPKVTPPKPSVTPTKPIATPPPPTTTDTKPMVTPTKPRVTPTKPMVTPSKPTAKPPPPTKHHTKPMVTPTKQIATSPPPTNPSTKPIVTPTKPIVIPTSTRTNHTKPMVTPTKPSVKSTWLPTKPTKPIATPPPSTTTSTKPIVIPTKPMVTSSKPRLTPTGSPITPTKPIATPPPPTKNHTKPMVIPTKSIATPPPPTKNHTKPMVIPTKSITTPPPPPTRHTKPMVTPTKSVITPTKSEATPAKPEFPFTKPEVTPTHQTSMPPKDTKIPISTSGQYNTTSTPTTTKHSTHKITRNTSTPSNQTTIPTKTTVTTSSTNTTTTTNTTTKTTALPTQSTHKPNDKFRKKDCSKKNGQEKYIKSMGDKCYFFQLDERVTFEKAQEICNNSFSGTLASVPSIRTNTLLQYQIVIVLEKNDRYWIGLKYDSHANPAGYYWQDGSAVTFQNFPNNHRMFECVAINTETGRWEEAGCQTKKNEAKLGYICEFDPTFKPPTPYDANK